MGNNWRAPSAPSRKTLANRIGNDTVNDADNDGEIAAGVGWEEALASRQFTRCVNFPHVPR
jgi:hypothetical protein